MALLRLFPATGERVTFMRIFYHLSDYVSFRTSGLAYINCLKLLGHDVFTSPEDISRADAAIIHNDPVAFAGIFERLPQLRGMRTIGYAVWEGSRLPQEYMEGLRLVREIWTCSRYSQKSFLEHFPGTAVVPHVVERLPVSSAALGEARERIGGVAENEFCFFSIVDAINPRKNIRDLLFAFSRARAESARPMRLILKQYRVSMDFSSIPGVCSVDGDLSPEALRALHSICHAYVSAHHAEGWGLGLSEAMAYGKPVIATGYSGNMDFMDAGNSFPVPFALAPVSEEMRLRLPWFTPDMVWADVDKAALILTMKRVAEGRYDTEVPRRAAAITERFGPAAVAKVIQALLEQQGDYARNSAPVYG